MFCWFCAPALLRSSLTAPAPEFVVLLVPAVPLPLVVDAAPPLEFAGTSPEPLLTTAPETGPLTIPPGVPCMPVAPPWLTMMSVSSTSGAALQAVMISCGCRVNPATTPVALLPPLLVSTVAPGGGAEEAARLYAATFPDSSVSAVHRAPGDYPAGKQGDVLTVEFTVLGIPCLGLNGGPGVNHTDAFSFQVATETQAETDRYWNAIVGNGGQESACGWCKDQWGLSWQITPRVLTDAMAAGGDEAKRAFAAMMDMKKIDVAKIEAARRG